MAKLYSVFCYNGLETWAVRVRGERLETREGGPSVVPTYRAIPRAQCLRRDPLAEMGRRIGGRIRAGFTRLGRGDFPCDRLRLVHPVTPSGWICSGLRARGCPARASMAWVPTLRRC